MDERIDLNRRRWDEMAQLHLQTYDIAGEDAGEHRLAPFELAELGELTGKRVCHLQCHLGGDSMVLARHGARVVGLDFSAEAISNARRRAEATGLADRLSFVQAPLDQARQHLEGLFDVVYTTWGVLVWLPSVIEWASVVASLLSPGGFLYLAESHPYAEALRWKNWDYGGAVGHFSDGQGDYTDATATFQHPQSWEWGHGLGEVVSAVAQAGLRLEFLHEHPFAVWDLGDVEGVVPREDGTWSVPGSTLPLSYSLRARREDASSAQPQG